MNKVTVEIDDTSKRIALGERLCLGATYQLEADIQLVGENAVVRVCSVCGGKEYATADLKDGIGILVLNGQRIVAACDELQLGGVRHFGFEIYSKSLNGTVGTGVLEVVKTSLIFEVDGETPAAYVGPRGEQGLVGPAGPQGVPGKSAYEVAVAAGYAGTLAQWLESLQGKTCLLAQVPDTDGKLHTVRVTLNSQGEYVLAVGPEVVAAGDASNPYPIYARLIGDDVFKGVKNFRDANLTVAQLPLAKTSGAKWTWMLNSNDPMATRKACDAGSIIKIASDLKSDTWALFQIYGEYMSDGHKMIARQFASTPATLLPIRFTQSDVIYEVQVEGLVTWTYQNSSASGAMAFAPYLETLIFNTITGQEIPKKYQGQLLPPYGSESVSFFVRPGETIKQVFGGNTRAVFWIAPVGGGFNEVTGE